MSNDHLSLVEKRKISDDSIFLQKKVDKKWRLILKAGISVLDQAFISGSSLILSVLLARWLDPGGYGAFAVGFTVFLFLSGFHNALILEPMSVLGPARYNNQYFEYFKKQIKIHFGFTGIISTLVLTICIFYFWSNFSNPLAGAIMGAGIVFPFILFLTLIRRFFYILRRPKIALIGSGIYFFLTIGGLLFLRWMSNASALNGFLVLGFFSFVASCVILLTFTPKNNQENKDFQKINDGILIEQWNYGKWLVVVAILYPVGTQLQLIMCAGYLDFEAAGVFRALQIPTLPIIQTIMAFSTLALPYLSADFGRGRKATLRKKGMFITIIFFGMAIIYELFLFGWSDTIENILYDGKFSSYSWLIPVFGLVGVFSGLAAGFSLMLRASQIPKHYFFISIVTMTSGIFSVIFFVPLWGIAGAIWSIVFTYGTSTVFTIYLCNSWVYHEKTGNNKARLTIE